ncbi:TRAP transporter small permease subunit [Oceaniovalibus sp. ACAM 378]|jgi:TRAP-type C4-dicarboxylate transport system permease small subunit|uniref:TRAP transporter small permease subunit n=1 Tax=Oceaniovalibus sp. ACAM 378 TaxID=2599923 RepID=UPI0011D6C21E|nr:TRAP transporter small permease [Oceaniovalibus sp. ACAM 378]TYB89451.1 TRAP transporter small permease [Oceaniovalibus sp. ACAM 378]
MLGKVIDFFTNILAELCGWMLLIVMGLILVDLISRATGTPIYGVSESAMFVMIAIVYLGVPYAEKMKAHVRVELILDKLSPRSAAIVDLAMYLLVVGTMAVVLYAVYINAGVSFSKRQAIAGPTPLLVWPVKFVMVVGLSLYLVQIIINVGQGVRTVVRAGSDDPTTKTGDA